MAATAIRGCWRLGAAEGRWDFIGLVLAEPVRESASRGRRIFGSLRPGCTAGANEDEAQSRRKKSSSWTASPVSAEIGSRNTPHLRVSVRHTADMRLLSQHQDARSLSDYLVEHLRDPSWTVFRAAVAFAKRSGVKYLRQDLPPFARRGTVKLSIGVSLRGTSREALSDLLALADPGEVWIFHDENGPTFHPKVYLFKNDRRADLLVGSGNLTEGGLVSNYEASLASSLDLSTRDGRQLLAEAESMLDSYCDRTDGAARRLDAVLLDQLFQRGYVPATDAAARPLDENVRPRSPTGASPSGGLFQRSQHRQRRTRLTTRQPPAPPAALPVTQQEPSPPIASIAPNAFVMTLRRTDVGRGQTTPGTQRRSAEVFIPLEAVRAQPEFWRWREAFVQRRTKAGHTHWFRDAVPFRIGNDQFLVNMMESTTKHDLRLRSETLRSSGLWATSSE